MERALLVFLEVVGLLVAPIMGCVPLALFLSPNYFGDLIRQATGETATAIIRNFVMQRATAYLHDGKTISETSEILGFEYPQHFTRVFKKHFGLTPREFLRK